MRLLELQRAQVKYRAARQYAHAARQAAGHTDGAVFQDRAYQVRSPITLITFDAWPLLQIESGRMLMCSLHTGSVYCK